MKDRRKNKPFCVGICASVLVCALFFFCFKLEARKAQVPKLLRSPAQSRIQLKAKPEKNRETPTQRRKKKIVKKKIDKKRGNGSFRELNRKASLKIYKKMARFPPDSAPLDPKKSEDFLENKFSPDVKEVLSLDDPTMSVRAWVSKNYYSLQDKNIVFNLIAMKKGKRSQAKIEAWLQNGSRVPYFRQNDGSYMAKLPVSSLQEGNHMATINVKVAGAHINTVNSFQIVGDYFEYKKIESSGIDGQGNLVFNPIFEILKTGPYLLEGTLYKDGEIVASAQHTVNLSAGERVVPLSFYGLIFYEGKHSGPFELRNLQLSYVDENLRSRGGKLISPKYFTEAFSWDEFNSSPYLNEVIDRKISKID